MRECAPSLSLHTITPTPAGAAHGTVDTSQKAHPQSATNLERVLVEAGKWPWVDPFYATPRSSVSWGRCAGEGEDKPDPGEFVSSERASGAFGNVGVEEISRAGLIDFRFETLDSGRCWLLRDDKREPMWGARGGKCIGVHHREHSTRGGS